MFNVDILEKLVKDFEVLHWWLIVAGRNATGRVRKATFWDPSLATLTENGPEITIGSLATGVEGDKTASEFIGLAKLSARACTMLAEYGSNMKSGGGNENVQEASFVQFVMELIKKMSR